MTYHVLLTEDAEVDLRELYEYLAHTDCIQSADRVLTRLMEVANSLLTGPERGAIARELRESGLNEYRQILFKPYRIIYRVQRHAIVVYLITDGRRDMQTLLSRRLLRSSGD